MDKASQSPPDRFGIPHSTSGAAATVSALIKLQRLSGRGEGRSCDGRGAFVQARRPCCSVEPLQKHFAAMQWVC